MTAGQHHTGLLLHEPILTADLAGMARHVTKWAYDVTLPDELPIALQRALKELTTPPYGPVFLSFPMDVVLSKYGAADPARVSRIARSVPEPDGIARAAAVLAGAARPLIVSGDGVGHARAWDELAALAETLGAPVHSEAYSTLWNFPSGHPLFAGPMPNLATAMRERFDDVDVLLLCGVTSQAPVSRHDGKGPLAPWRVRTVAVDDSPWEVGKNQPVEVGLVGDVRATLAAPHDALRRAGPDPARVEARTAAWRERRAARERSWDEKVHAARSSERISPTLVAAELRELLPPARSSWTRRSPTAPRS